MGRADIGIIGGSGLYDLAGISEPEEVSIETPFGPPSDPIRLGILAGRRVAFLARHGRGHRLLPSEINYRANLFAMKLLGVTRIVSASAVGSLREYIHPLDLVLPDQFYDRTRGRISTFFGGGVAAHIAFADPICPELIDLLAAAGPGNGKRLHRGGTYLCMEGPQFSTKAESRAYRAMGHDVIGMTNLQEAKLAREAEICFATLALVTDYDCWHEEESVTVEVVVKRLQENAATATAMIRRTLETLPDKRACGCGRALEGSILTRAEHIPVETRARLAPILDKYLGGQSR